MKIQGNRVTTRDVEDPVCYKADAETCFKDVGSFKLMFLQQLFDDVAFYNTHPEYKKVKEGWFNGNYYSKGHWKEVQEELRSIEIRNYCKTNSLNYEEFAKGMGKLRMQKRPGGRR